MSPINEKKRTRTAYEVTDDEEEEDTEVTEDEDEEVYDEDTDDETESPPHALYVLTIDGVPTHSVGESVVCDDNLADNIAFCTLMRKLREGTQMSKDDIIQMFDKRVAIYSGAWGGGEARLLPVKHTLAEYDAIIVKAFEDAQAVPPPREYCTDQAIYNAEVSAYIKWAVVIK